MAETLLRQGEIVLGTFLEFWSEAGGGRNGTSYISRGFTLRVFSFALEATILKTTSETLGLRKLPKKLPKPFGRSRRRQKRQRAIKI